MGATGFASLGSRNENPRTVGAPTGPEKAILAKIFGPAALRNLEADSWTAAHRASRILRMRGFRERAGLGETEAEVVVPVCRVVPVTVGGAHPVGFVVPRTPPNRPATA